MKMIIIATTIMMAGLWGAGEGLHAPQVDMPSSPPC